MESVGVSEAKSHFSQIMERVKQGEYITITKHGVPVAVISPVRKLIRKDRKLAITHLIAFRQDKYLKDSLIRNMIDEGRP
ncbi:MAG: type II toxin-antitoxin system Phd/YefM family antitoxin [Armatimonadota bacterium]